MLDCLCCPCTSATISAYDMAFCGHMPWEDLSAGHQHQACLGWEQPTPVVVLYRVCSVHKKRTKNVNLCRKSSIRAKNKQRFYKTYTREFGKRINTEYAPKCRCLIFAHMYIHAHKIQILLTHLNWKCSKDLSNLDWQRLQSKIKYWFWVSRESSSLWQAWA